MTDPLDCYAAVLFDFDGTLADSFAAIASSVNHVRAQRGMPALGVDEVKRHVGHGAEYLLTHTVPGGVLADDLARYRAHHPGIMLPLTQLLPGAADLVTRLHRRGKKLGVCSNKRVESTRRLVEALGFGPHIACVLGPEDVGGRPKPDPLMVLEGVRRLGVSPAAAVYVGDMDVDVQTGKAAGVPVWLVPGGAIGEEAALAAGPDRVLRGFSELLELLPGVS